MIVEIPSACAKDVSLPLIRNWPITIFSLGVFFLFIFLGVWQLDRAEQKLLLKQKIENRLSLQPKNISNFTYFQEYTSVSLIGAYRKEVYFLDNRTRNGLVGYEILQIFSTEKSDWLVNRGWVAASDDREKLPALKIPLGARSLQGYLYPVISEPNANPILDPKFDNRIQQVDTGFTEDIGLSNKDWSIRLFADSDTALVTEWKFFNSGPEKHHAYAFQWFAMSIAVWFLWFYSATNIVPKFRRRFSGSVKMEFQNERK
ncbi:SURF1 family protein [Microbulbifer sp. ZKSA006]|uniref:SURF1 family protein n=1 Tax=Microbulbifer sp. ZKSA006 TaxID=3243390 RepID=UPI0040399E8A